MKILAPPAVRGISPDPSCSKSAATADVARQPLCSSPAEIRHTLDPDSVRTVQLAYCKPCREKERQLPQIRLLKGAAVDILDDGTLDLDDATLQELDLVVISVHSKLTMDRKAMNRRVVRALRHPPQASRGVHADIPARVPRSGGWRRQ